MLSSAANWSFYFFTFVVDCEQKVSEVWLRRSWEHETLQSGNALYQFEFVFMLCKVSISFTETE